MFRCDFYRIEVDGKERLVDLWHADEFGKKLALAAIEERNAEEFGMAGYSVHGSLCLVAANENLLKDLNMYEEALVEAYIGCKHDHRYWLPSRIEQLFDRADRERLRACGDPFPSAGPYTLYRGVCRLGRARQVTGLSWTDDLDAACWFALRRSGDPAIYTATIKQENVYLYTNGRHESEFVCRPKRPKRLDITVAEMQTGWDRVDWRKRERQKREIETWKREKGERR